MAVWKDAAGKNRRGVILSLHKIFEGQFRIPPVASLAMAFETSRALTIFYAAPDAADQEKALVPLEAVFSRLQNATESKYSAHAAARLALMIWTLRADHANRGQLASAWADLIGLLYGRPAADAIPTAKLFAQVAKLADEGKWDDAQESASIAWAAVKSLSSAP
ncbi:MAG: hypothetical protein WCS65_02450 [Verrucomicrobiae bacterium]